MVAHSKELVELSRMSPELISLDDFEQSYGQLKYPSGYPRKKFFSAAGDAGHFERNAGRSEARPSCSEDHARPTLRSSTKTVFPANFQLAITLFKIVNTLILDSFDSARRALSNELSFVYSNFFTLKMSLVPPIVFKFSGTCI